MRGIAQFIMRGRLHAIGLAAIFGGISVILLPLSYLSAATVGLVGLRKGWLEGVIVMLVTGGIVLAISSMVDSRPGVMLPQVLMLLLPVLVCVLVLQITESQGCSLLCASVFAAGFVLVMHIILGDVVVWWEAWLTEAIKGVKGASVEEFKKEGTLRLMNGLVAFMFGVSIMISVLISRWWQSLLFYPGGFSKEFHGLSLPKLVLPGTVAVLLVANSIGQVLLADLFMVALMMYFFQGLAVIHGVVAQRKLSKWLLTPIYFGIILMPQYTIAGLALVGSCDSLIRFRFSSPKQ